jgi:hypothetical protein
MANTTGIAVGCAIGIPTFFAFCIAFFFLRKNRKRLNREDLEYQQNQEIREIDQDLSYDNMDQLKVDNAQQDFSNGLTSEESDQERREKSQEDLNNDNNSNGNGSNKKQRYVPAYKKKMRSSMNNLGNSRNSSFSNLNPPNALGSSNASINTNSTNLTDNFYTNVPVLDNDSQANEASTANSADLARSLQLPTPSYSKRPPMNRTSSTSTMHTEEEYDLKNNYDLANEGEIQEEDQYENEFTNYSENKRAFIEGLRPKVDQ